MSELDTAEKKVTAWLQPLPDAAAPCGPDLEYDNDFLALTQAAQGKPESQFGPAEAADWRRVVEIAEGLFERTRDLRIAIFWARAVLHTLGFAALPAGLRLLVGLIESHWEHLHPLPDPDDGDAFARVNALTLLREPEGLLGDLRSARVIDNRAIGELDVRAIEVRFGLSPARSGEAEIGKEQIMQMVAAALAKTPAMRELFNAAQALLRQLMTLIEQKLGSGTAPDLRPVYALVGAVVSTLPPQAGLADGAEDGEATAGGTAASGARRGLAGAVSSRDEAIRAIDMVCEYLERAEPTNPAPLFLRRARQLISHNFLQLMKVLAPDALSEVARVVGVDPDSVTSPE